MACNPTPQFNDYVGDGVVTDYQFTFSYIKKTEVQVRTGVFPNFVDVATTEYTIDDANPTVVSFNTAPTGEFRIYRCTDADVLPATFQAGGAIRAADLNDNFEAMLNVVQDSNVRSSDAAGNATSVYNRAEEAVTIANSAVTAADEAKAVADSAVVTANDAETKAAQALDLVSETTIGKTVADVAALPTSPSSIDFYTVIDSTGVESLSPAPVYLPNGFVGNSNVSVKLYWNLTQYEFIEAYARDPDARYLLTSIGDLPDVDTSSADHIPADGQSLVWNASMNHWMPADATLDIPSLPELP